MASGGMAELRAAEQKAAQIVQEARQGACVWHVVGLWGLGPRWAGLGLIDAVVHQWSRLRVPSRNGVDCPGWPG